MDPHCNELYTLAAAIEKGFLKSLEEISQEHLNYSPAANKMSIGQLAVHCAGWAQYFLSEIKWTPEMWTCVSVTYPLTVEQVLREIKKGFLAIYQTLSRLNDISLEISSDGRKGPGYIIYRLLIHAMVDANQMAYLRQIVEPEWNFGSAFGDMATAVIQTEYHTDPDIEIPGF